MFLQFPEKLIPLVLSNELEGKEIPVYGDGSNIREWIHVEDHCSALDLVIRQGQPGEIYNVGTGNGITNLDLITLILDSLEKPRKLMRFVTDRPGHDQRYALDPNKIIKELGWMPTISFVEGMQRTIQWYLENESWWRRIKSGEYTQYYQRMYANR